MGLNLLFHFAVPSSPLNVTVANQTSTTLLVTWLSPSKPNGVLTNFELCYTGVYSVNPVLSSFHQLQCTNISFPAVYSLLEDLVPYSNYTISVRAVTGAGPGNSSTEIKGITKEDGKSPQYAVLWTRCSGCVYNIKISHRPCYRTKCTQGIFYKNVNFCTGIGCTRKVKKGDGIFFHFPAVITYLGEKDCEVNRRWQDVLLVKIR